MDPNDGEEDYGEAARCLFSFSWELKVGNQASLESEPGGGDFNDGTLREFSFSCSPRRCGDGPPVLSFHGD